MSSQPSKQTKESRQIDVLKSQVMGWEIFNNQIIAQLETQREFLNRLSDKLELMSNMLQEEQ